MELTQEDLKNILVILSRSTTQIAANEAQAVGALQQKIHSMISVEEPTKEAE